MNDSGGRDWRIRLFLSALPCLAMAAASRESLPLLGDREHRANQHELAPNFGEHCGKPPDRGEACILYFHSMSSQGFRGRV